MIHLLKTFAPNLRGRDFAVGDIHGHFTRLQRALDSAWFDPANDRLFSCGDLVDRGPECERALEWLAKPWFHPVRGNHDDYVCRYNTCDTGNWLQNGGMWFAGLPRDEQAEHAAQFRELPVAIEVETPGGLIGIVHADCVLPDWGQLQFELAGGTTPKRLKQVMNSCMWSRSRIEFGEMHGVQGVRAVVCGHTPVRAPVVLNNVYHIDTKGWAHDGEGYFTLLDLHSLETIPSMRPGLSWS